MADKNLQLMKIDITTPDYGSFQSDMAVDLKVDKSNLSDEMEQQPSLYAWWASLAEYVRNQHSRKKFELQVLEAELDEEFRQEADRDNIKATEKWMEGKIHRDSRWKNLSGEVLDLRYKVGILDSATWSFQQRAEMIKALAPTAAYESRIEHRETEQKPVRTPVTQ